jgi:hypothetical protein
MPARVRWVTGGWVKVRVEKMIVMAMMLVAVSSHVRILLTICPTLA